VLWLENHATLQLCDNMEGLILLLTKRLSTKYRFFCGGVPSVKGTEKILERLDVPLSNVDSVKYRGNGWPGKATALLKDGTKRQMSYESAWGNILNKHLQFRWKICPDGIGEFADIVCGDAWYATESGKPDFSEHPGRSLVITRTESGKRC
jgi:coenzyme F420 hydrogenase subunit beta